MKKKPVFSTRKKSIYQLIEEISGKEPITTNVFNNKGVEVVKKIYNNGLWVKEMTFARKKVKIYSAKIDNKIIKTETVEYILPINKIDKLIHLEINNMFNQLEGSVWQ